MQLVINSKSKDKYNVYFNERETHNIRTLLDSPINDQNRKLCYYIENLLSKTFEQFKEKRPMVMHIDSGYNYISTEVMVDEVAGEFQKLSDILFKITKVSFSNEEAFDTWLNENKYHFYQVREKTSRGIVVNLYNLRLEEEASLALNENAKVISSGSVLEYMCNKTIKLLKECMQN